MGGEAVNDQDMSGVEQGAEHDNQVPGGNGKRLRHAQEVQPRHRQRNAPRQQQGGLAAEQQEAEQRYEDDVHGGNKPGLARRSPHGDAQLLGKGRQRQHCAAGAAPQQQEFLSRPVQLEHVPPSRYEAGSRQVNQQQRQEGDDITHTVKSKRADILRAHALGGKTKAPDQCGQQGQGVLFHSAFHGTSPLCLDSLLTGYMLVRAAHIAAGKAPQQSAVGHGKGEGIPHLHRFLTIGHI